MTLRVLFAAEPGDEARVRTLVDEALARGEGEDPDGVRTSWRLLRSARPPRVSDGRALELGAGLVGAAELREQVARGTLGSRW